MRNPLTQPDPEPLVPRTASATDDRAIGRTVPDTLRAATAEVFRLAWPAAVQGLVATVVFFTDRLILGRYSADALGSTAISGPVVWSVFAVFGAYAAGIVAVVGRQVGANQIASANRTTRTMLRLSAVVGVAVAVLCLALRDPLVSALAGGSDTSDIVRDWGAQYLTIAFLASPVFLISTAATTALQASGDTRTPMRIGVIIGVVNLIVSFVLVNGYLGMPELAVRGAAIGTVIAFSLQALLAVLALYRGTPHSPLNLGSAECEPSEPALHAVDGTREAVRISVPTFQERVVYHTAYLAFIALIGHLGNTSMAAHQSLIAIESITFIVAGGFGVAAGTLVAQHLGAGRPSEAMRAGWIASGLGSSCMIVVSLVFIICPEPLVGLFTDDAEVVALGATCLRIAAVAQPLMAATDGFAGALRGAGDTRTPMIAAFIGPVFVRLSACWFLAYPMGMGLVGIWIGSSLDWAVRAVFLGAALRRLQKREAAL